MVDIHTIIADYRSRKKDGNEITPVPEDKRIIPTTSDIPDVFFDTILGQYKLSRQDIMIIMYLYRVVWCRPNLHKEFGISPLLSHTEMAKNLKLQMEDIYVSLRRLEEFGFISTIRSGQYFVRKYFSKDLDELYGQDYDEFEF